MDDMSLELLILLILIGQTVAPRKAGPPPSAPAAAAPASAPVTNPEPIVPEPPPAVPEPAPDTTPVPTVPAPVSNPAPNVPVTEATTKPPPAATTPAPTTPSPTTPAPAIPSATTPAPTTAAPTTKAGAAAATIPAPTTKPAAAVPATAKPSQSAAAPPANVPPPPDLPPDIPDEVLKAQAESNANALLKVYSEVGERNEALWSTPNDAVIQSDDDIPTQPLGTTNYTIFRKRANWFRAHEYCRKYNKILAVFPTVQSYDEVAQLIFDISVFDPHETQEFLGARRYWIGLNDWAGEGEWRWIDTGDRLTYSRWYDTQPDHINQPNDLTHKVRVPGKPAAHCALMWNPKFELGNKHTWDDSICTGTDAKNNVYHYFICQNFVETTKKY